MQLIYYLDTITRNVIRPWFLDIDRHLSDGYDDFLAYEYLVYLALFISIIVIVFVIYLIFWQNFEKRLKEEFRISVDLINLIPEEIKIQIIKKIIEEEEKAEL